MTRFYPMARQGIYESVAALCQDIGAETALIDYYMINAAIESSSLVVCDQIRLGNSSNNACAVLQLVGEGHIVLWIGFFSELAESPSEIETWIGEHQRHFGVPMAVGEFKPRRRGHA